LLESGFILYRCFIFQETNKTKIEIVRVVHKKAASTHGIGQFPYWQNCIKLATRC